jgi:hypothetical protein
MPIDPSIALNVAPVQVANPLDSMSKALTIKSLMQEGKIRDQEIQGNQAVKDAFANNVGTDAQGNQSVDRKGVLSDLYKTNPMQAMGLEKQFQERDQQTLALHTQQAKQIAWSIPNDPGTPPEMKQAAWTAAKQQALAAGLPGAQQSPDQYPGDGFVQQMKMHTMSAEEQMAQQNKTTDQTTSRGTANASLAEAGLPTLPAIGGVSNQGAASRAPQPSGGASPQGGAAGSGGFTPPPKMRQKAMEDYNSAVAGSRQQADATQSLKDIQAGQKLSEIANQAPGGDLNKLTNQQTKLAITELVKMAGGSVPTESELEQMSPDNYAQKYAGLLQKITNSPQPANAGEFLKQGIDYAHGIQGLGAQKLADRANEFADRQRPYLGEAQYKQVKGQIADEFKKNTPVSRAGQGGGPKVGDIEDGHKFLGGNPADPKSWQAVR